MFHVIVPFLPLLSLIGQYILLIFTGIITIAHAIIALRDFVRWRRRRRLQKRLSKTKHDLQQQECSQLSPTVIQTEKVRPTDKKVAVRPMFLKGRKVRRRRVHKHILQQGQQER